MPISADPNRTAEFSLETDLDKPTESRPVFICRYMSVRDHQKARMHWSRPGHAQYPEGDRACAGLLLTAIGIGVVGGATSTGPSPLMPFPMCSPMPSCGSLPSFTLLKSGRVRLS